MAKYKGIKIRVEISKEALLDAAGQAQAKPEPKPEPEVVKPDG